LTLVGVPAVTATEKYLSLWFQTSRDPMTSLRRVQNASNWLPKRHVLELRQKPSEINQI
jgi:hypothetical protein